MHKNQYNRVIVMGGGKACGKTHAFKSYLEHHNLIKTAMSHVRTINPGHKYDLLNFEDPHHSSPQTILFINKEKVDGSDQLRTVHNGTTNEAVIQMLVHRLEFLYEKLPSEETKNAITHLKKALAELNARTKKREKAGVEGTHKPVDEQSEPSFEDIPWHKYLVKNGLESIEDVKAALEGDGLAGLKYFGEDREKDVADFLESL